MLDGVHCALTHLPSSSCLYVLDMVQIRWLLFQEKPLKDVDTQVTVPSSSCGNYKNSTGGWSGDAVTGGGWMDGWLHKNTLKL